MSEGYEVFQDDAGEWRWHLKAQNGEIVSQSESYGSKYDAERGVEDAKAAAQEAGE